MSNRRLWVTAKVWKEAALREDAALPHLGVLKEMASTIEPVTANKLKELQDRGLLFRSPTDPEPDRLQIWTISSETPDREGDELMVEGWDLSNYTANPVVLWGHSMAHESDIIGRSLAVWPEGSSLKALCEYMPGELNPRAESVYQMTRGGWLSASSVGFLPREWEPGSQDKDMPGFRFTSMDLLEWSVVPVPMHPSAMVEARSAGIDVEPLIEWAVEILDRTRGSALLLPFRERIEEAIKMSKSESTQVPDDVEPKAEGEPEEEPNEISLQELADSVARLEAAVESLTADKDADSEEEAESEEDHGNEADHESGEKAYVPVPLEAFSESQEVTLDDMLAAFSEVVADLASGRS